MTGNLTTTRWNRFSIRLNVPTTMGVFLIGGTESGPEPVLLVGSTRNLRRKLLQLLEFDELRSLSARCVHWVADLSVEQARLAERQLVRRYDPPLNVAPQSRYFDILAG